MALGPNGAFAKAFDDATDPTAPQISTTHVGTASAYAAGHKKEMYGLLSGVFDEATNTIRVVSI